MGITYGLDISDDNDAYICVAEQALDGMSKASQPGAFWVDLFPVCEYILTTTHMGMTF